MSTRGAIGFRIGGVDKVTYNHSDSYPSELGKAVLEYIAANSIEKMKLEAAKIALLDADVKPTAEQIEACKKFTDLGVNNQSTDDWYCLMRGAQGDLMAYAEIGLMIDGHEFLIDSLFCEWAYIVNLDSGKLEVYHGFNKNPKGAGRYAKLKEKPWKDHGGKLRKAEYNGVVLLQEHDLEELRKGFTNRFGKLKPEQIVAKLTKSWELQADELREAEKRRAEAKKKPAPHVDI